MERYFFEIPVYRCQLDKYEAELEAEKHRYIDLFLPQYPPGILVSSEEVGRWFTESRWYPWRYNEVISWLRLYVFGKDQIRAEYYFIKAKRVVRHPAGKVFLKRPGKAFELCVLPKESSAVIFRNVLRALENLHREPPFKGRYIDLDCFRALGKFINWRQLVGLRKSPIRAEQRR